MNSNRKYVVIVGDGMSDYPLDVLGSKTPLEAADTPNMDIIAKKSIVGLAKTVPDGMNPGSDTANLSIFGYNPQKYYTGRSPLEAISMGIELGENDVAFRCNLVSIKDNLMNDFTSNHIDTKLTKIIIEELKKNLTNSDIELYAGVSYRNTLVWRNYPFKSITTATPPHDIQGQDISKYTPSGDGSILLNELTELSKKIITESPFVKKAIKDYKGNPTSIWLWGGGRRPSMDTYQQRYNLSGATISAVDLIHGIGLAAGLQPKFVEGVTGYIDTNYTGKAEAALEVLEESDFVFLHVESPDESGHEGNIEHKLQSIEDLDKKVIGPVLKGLEKYEDYTVLIMPDHATPISLRTHVSDPVPFCLYNSMGNFQNVEMKRAAKAYTETEAEATGVYLEDASRLVDIMINGKID